MVFEVDPTTLIKAHFHNYLTAKYSYVFIRIRAYGKNRNDASQNNQNISAMKRLGPFEQQFRVQVYPQLMLHPQFRKSIVICRGRTSGRRPRELDVHQHQASQFSFFLDLYRLGFHCCCALLLLVLQGDAAEMPA